jgi:hypothetical protein
MEEFLSSSSRLAWSFVEAQQILLSHFSTTNSERWQSSRLTQARLVNTVTWLQGQQQPILIAIDSDPSNRRFHL